MPRDVWNPPLRFASSRLELDAGEASTADLEVVEEHASSIVSANESPDLSFRLSANAYRGCFHGCTYCYARTTHGFLGLGEGTDFERRIVVKRNAPALLRDAFMSRSHRGDTVVFSGATDPYQPLEARYGLTRAMLEVCLEFRSPVGVITKSTLVTRDLDLLAALAVEARCLVTVSCAFSSDDDARVFEPFAPPPSKRIEVIRALADAGVPVAVSLAPTIPGVNDAQIPEVLKRAREAGATSAFHTLLRLPGGVEAVFRRSLDASMPLRAQKVMNGLRAMRARERDAEFHARFRGDGARYEAVEALFTLHAKRLGFTPHRFAEDDDAASPFRRPTRQLGLFDR